MKLLVGFLLIGAAGALCIGDGNPCSGHGNCGAHDKCTCQANWQGVDCGERTCPFDISFTEVAYDSVGTETVHVYAECSSKGVCDRKSGECKCFDGYDGRACTRMKCENDCSGRGTCLALSKVAVPDGVNQATYGYKGWDQDKIQGCKCDPGWEGTDCSLRKCPRGDDPVSTHETSGNTNVAQVDEVQTLTISGNRDAGTQFTLKYTDYRGETWETIPIDRVAPTAIQIEEALEGLPNSAIPSVTVTLDTACASGSACVFTITFSDDANSGDQPALEVVTAFCDTDGCQPRIAWGNGNSASTNVGSLVVAEGTKGTKEFAVCSNRGSCDGETGQCVCANGYTGQRCEDQTTHV